jgi:hypothetical protein
MGFLEDRVDMAKVQERALAGADRLAEVQPQTARLIRRVVRQTGGAALHVARWDDDEAAIAVAGVEVWRGPLADILRPLDA